MDVDLSLWCFFRKLYNNIANMMAAASADSFIHGLLVIRKMLVHYCLCLVLDNNNHCRFRSQPANLNVQHRPLIQFHKITETVTLPLPTVKCHQTNETRLSMSIFFGLGDNVSFMWPTSVNHCTFREQSISRST